MMDIEKIIESTINKMKLIDSADIPAIDLYMDQVTTFMEKNLKEFKRYEDDKILTKTMINNYAKNNLLPPPEKKRYSKEHVLMLVFIYYFKSVMSITDIKKMLTPLADRYFENNGSFKLEEIYEEVATICKEEMEHMKAEVAHELSISRDRFEDLPKKEKEFLQNFVMVCVLSYDMYIKKQLLESIIDSMPDIDDIKNKKEKDKKSKKN